jgi:hypothetical protein
LILIAFAATSCKKKKEPDPEPVSTQPATGHSITKKKGSGAEEADDGAQSGSGSSHVETGGGGKPLDGVTSISVGGTRACAITADEKLWCWQQGGPAELMDGPGPVRAVANASCALLDDLSLWCWPHRLTVNAAGMDGAGQIAASATDVCAARRMFVWCWKPDDDHARTQFDWGGVGKLVVGNGRVCSVVGGGELECMPIGSEEHRAEIVSGVEDLDVLAMQGTLSCATRTKGGVECWTDPKQRLAIPGVSSASDIQLGPAGDACVLGGDRSVTCWKLTMSPLAIERPPAPVTGVSALAISVGSGFACAAGDDKKARCWSTGDGTPQIVAKK